MKLNWTVDNILRHPLRWGKCPVAQIDDHKTFGITFETRYETLYIKKRWVLVIYYGSGYKAWSNYPLK